MKKLYNRSLYDVQVSCVESSASILPIRPAILVANVIYFKIKGSTQPYGCKQLKKTNRKQHIVYKTQTRNLRKSGILQVLLVELSLLIATLAFTFPY